MHMADALISPAVGATLWAATGATVAYCSRRITLEHDDRRVALMGVLGAFIFAAQMINFTIPGTGSSGHLGGGMILAILLGPHAAFLVMASVLTVQALFFADGGLLALGCNIFNLAFIPCFIAFPLLYKSIVGNNPGEKRILTGSIVAAVVGLQLGSLGVVLETVVSGVAELPFTAFLLVMQPIHFAIGIVEGCVTAAIVLFIRQARPEILASYTTRPLSGAVFIKTVLLILTLTLFISGGLSWFASTRPDGLEWAIARVTGHEEIVLHKEKLHSDFAAAQEKIAMMPDYTFPGMQSNAGTSLAGLAGGVLTLVLTGFIGVLLKRRRARP